MPGVVWLTNRDTGQQEPIAPEQVAAALGTGKYLDPGAVAVHQNGLDTFAAPDVARQEQAFTPAIDPTVAARAAGHTLREQENSGVVAGAKAALGGTVSGLSFGLLDPFQEEQEFNRIASVGGQIVGALAPALVGDEAGLLGLGRLGRGAAVADDALTAERATSALSSRALFGGKAAEGAGELEQGLGRANAALRGGAEAAQAADAAAAAGLEGLDAKGLRAAHEAEIEAIKAARVPQRAQLADDIGAFRQQTRDDKLWLTTKKTAADGGAPPITWSEFQASKMSEYMASEGGHAGAMKRLAREWEEIKAGRSVPGVPIPTREPAIDGLNVIGKRTLKADRQLDRLLDNPKAFAARPERALEALQQQESALEDIIAKSDKLRVKFAADTSGERLAALDKIPAALEQNRALQTRIAQLTAEPMSPRLQAIADAKDMLAAGGAAKSLPEQMLGGAVFSGVAGLAHALPGIGSMLAPLAGAKASKLVTDLVFGKLGKTTAEAASHASDAVAQFLGRAARTPQPIVLGTKALAAAAFAPAPPRPAAAPAAPKKTTAAAPSHELEAHYRRVTDEIRSLTAYDETGTPRMRPEARRALGARFDAVRAVSPPLADRMETVAARRVEYLAGIIPKLPDYGTVQIGPDRRRTPELQMRTFARAVAVLENPRALLSRAAHGRVTPGEAAAFRAGYPEMLADFTNQIVTELPTLQRTLPRKQRLALSILTGVPVDPAMTPSIQRVIQGMYASEPGTQGGTQAPSPQPQFGSVKRSDPGTASQRRQGLTAP